MLHSFWATVYIEGPGINVELFQWLVKEDVVKMWWELPFWYFMVHILTECFEAEKIGGLSQRISHAGVELNTAWLLYSTGTFAMAPSVETVMIQAMKYNYNVCRCNTIEN